MTSDEYAALRNAINLLLAFRTANEQKHPYHPVTDSDFKIIETFLERDVLREGVKVRTDEWYEQNYQYMKDGSQYWYCNLCEQEHRPYESVAGCTWHDKRVCDSETNLPDYHSTAEYAIASNWLRLQACPDTGGSC